MLETSVTVKCEDTTMSTSNVPPYVLQELPDISEVINSPLKSAQRIKYTCFDVSKNVIVFGATSGGLYVFNRQPCEFLQLIPNQEGVITKVAISPDEKYIAFANGKGVVSATECTETKLHSGCIQSKEHTGNEVTAMIWSQSPQILYIGDDVGRVSLLQIPNFITKTMFQTTTQIIMNLDTRICQIDIKNYMLLVSTLTRCYICDTSNEQYRQIGQKLRDGEFGACFFTTHMTVDNGVENDNTVKTQTKEVKTYNVIGVHDNFGIGDEFKNTHVYCARPSSRLWEATVDGIVKRTHQFKVVLGKAPFPIMSVSSYDNENIPLTKDVLEEPQAVNFSKIFSMKGAIFSYKKDAIYFLNPTNVEDTIWFDSYKDIVDCKVFKDTVYVWLQNGSIVSLLFLKIDKFLIRTYLDEKFTLCAEMCNVYNHFLLKEFSLSKKLHIILGLKDKLLKNDDILSKITEVLDKIESDKLSETNEVKSGIVVVDNSFYTQTLFDEDVDLKKGIDENKYNPLPPEAIQTLKDLSLSVTDKFMTSKNKLKEKWDDLEEKMKNLGVDKQEPLDVRQPGQELPSDDINSLVEILKEDIIYKESSQPKTPPEVDEKIVLIKTLYEQFKLSLANKEKSNNINHILNSYSCDIRDIYELLIKLQDYCKKISNEEESKHVSSIIFLNHILLSSNRSKIIEDVIENQDIYQYFVDACIIANLKGRKIENQSCDCGFPLPFIETNKKPLYSDLIDEFIEKQWSSQSKTECYEICKKMPYLWRKILYLRRNEDLLNILNLILQILDENLLHTFLPQFTIDTWDKAIKLYATLNSNLCLNCGIKFERTFNEKQTLSWNAIGALLIKSVGGRNAVKLMENNADIIQRGDLNLMFYHTAMLAALYEKFDGTIRNQLVDALYEASTFEDAAIEIARHLKTCLAGQLKNTSLPLLVAAKSPHWGLSVKIASRNKMAADDTFENGIESNSLDEKLVEFAGMGILTTFDGKLDQRTIDFDNISIKENVRKSSMCFESILDNLKDINNGITDCSLCGLPLVNLFLIKDGGLWVFKCGHTFHGVCLDLLKLKLCPSCEPKNV